MKLYDFPHCCTAKIIVDFGESAVAEGGSHNTSTEAIKKYITEQMDAFYHQSYAMFVATTNSDQTRANKALRDLGFRHSTWMSKKAHKETKVRLWWKPIQ